MTYIYATNYPRHHAHNTRKDSRLLLRSRIFVGVGCVLIVGLLSYMYGSDSLDKGHHDTSLSALRQVTHVMVDRQVDWSKGTDENLLRMVDFGALRERNSDVSRWLYVPGTGIDHPVMQEHDVGKYKYNDRDIDGNYDIAGSLLVPASPPDHAGQMQKDAHIMVLGHRMRSWGGEWQFSHVPTRWADEQGAKDYPYIYLYYPDHAERWRVWSAIDADAHDPVYETPYKVGSKDYAALLDHITALSRYTIGQGPTKDNPVLILSTCNWVGGDNDRRFAVVSVPDAMYFYDSGRMINASQYQQLQQWDHAMRKVDENAEVLTYPANPTITASQRKDN